jgi:hypothetical protein
MVVNFDRDAHLLEDQRHFRAHVLALVDRGHGEVAALDGRTVALVAVLVVLARVPGGFLGVDLDRAALHAHVPLDGVEDEEFGFRAEVGGVAHAGGLHVGLGALGQRTRVALVGLAIAGLDDVAGQDQRGFFEERVDVGRVRVRHQLHVRRFDALPAGDRRAVERVAGDELVFVEVRDRHGNVLFLATGIGETEVNELDFVFLHQLHHVGDGLGHQRAPCLFG